MSRNKERKALNRKQKNLRKGATTATPVRGNTLPANWLNSRDKESAKQLTAQQYLNKADQFLNTGKIENALEVIEEGLIAHPDDVLLLGVSGFLFSKIGLIKNSLARTQKALSYSPDDQMLLVLAFANYRQMGYHANAIEALRHLQRLGPHEEFFNQSHQEALETMEKEMTERAELAALPLEELTQTLREIENSQYALINHDAEGAVNHAINAVAYLPLLPLTINNLVPILFLTGRAKDAHQYAAEHLARYPDDSGAINNMILLLCFARKIDEAKALHPSLIEAFKKQLATAGDDPQTLNVIYSNLGLSLGALDDPQSIYELFAAQAGNTLDLRSDFYRTLAAACWNLGKDDEAALWWSKIKEEEKTDTDIGIQIELKRVRPPESPPYKVPYLSTDDLVPVLTRQLLIIVNEKKQLVTVEMPRVYRELAPYYLIKEALMADIILADSPKISDALATIMLAFDAPELVEALRDFALGVYGSDTNRAMVTLELINNNQLPAQEMIHFWSSQKGVWEDKTPQQLVEVVRAETK